MRKTDTLFLICVLIFAGLFAARSITQSVTLLPTGRSFDSETVGVAGQSRDVDMRKLKQLLDRRALSDREAEFYEPVDASGPVDQAHDDQLQEDQASDLGPE